MDEIYQQEAGFGEDREDLENDELEDEIVSDEVSEEDPEDNGEYEESEEEDIVSEKKERDRSQLRINRLTKERYNAENKAKKYAAELESMRQKNEMLSKLALEQSSLNANARLEKAKSAQKAAFESGDTDAQADASVAISLATSDLQEISREKLRIEHDDRVRQYQAPQQYEQPDIEIAQEWAQENNDWINPQSKKYDQELSEYIRDIDERLGNDLRSKGMTHLIGSLEYMDKIDEYKDYFLNQRSQYVSAKQNTNQRRELSMRPVRGGVSPVRNSSQSQNRNIRQLEITPAEKALLEQARQFGVTDEIYLKYKRDDINGRRREERGG